LQIYLNVAFEKEVNRLGSWILRFLLFFTCGISGYYLSKGTSSSPLMGLWGLLGGLFLATLALVIETSLKKIPLKNLLGSFVGLTLGIIVANFLSDILLPHLMNQQRIVLPLYGVIYGVCGYVGLLIGFKKGDEIHPSSWKFLSKEPPRSGNTKILDTSVIIDGRIADITETGFVEGTLIIPQFVLSELQHIADSSDPIKRTRGKRGLEVLHHIQKQVNTDVKIVDTDYPSIKEVDAKLIELGKEVGGKIITNDFNLNKVAELQGIAVLNINELASALKPVVLPGEEMSVKILREGKEMGQGVAYLEDGTMIVIDNGRKQMGKTVETIVTSVLQTPAGRMIFARLKEDTSREGTKGKEYYYPLDSEY
jgi:uncharacterized protein YacL